MSEDLLKALMNGLGIAAFERRADGSFGSLAPLPRWFARLAGDGTFPFLGHILEEAGLFWTKGEPMLREWGPCAELDEVGQEFHYKVTAVTMAPKHYLIFQLDPGSDRMQKMLQKVRNDALASEQRASADAAFAIAMEEVKIAAEQVRDVLRSFSPAAAASADVEQRTKLAATCDELLRRVDAFNRLAAS
jgi:hypothetical protein